MYIKKGSTSYTKIRNLNFAPEVDITCSEIRSNQFSVDIFTSDTFSFGDQVILYDDFDIVWAAYYVYTSDRVSDNIVRVVARDLIWMLDGRTMPQSIYYNEPFSDIVDEIFEEITDEYGSGLCFIDSGLDNATITGYFPQGSARSRLQKLCFAVGAYILSTGPRINILQYRHSNEKTIPTSRIFYRPELQYEDYISSIRCKYYAYSQISTRDDNVEWIEVNGNYYQKKELEVIVYNPDCPIEVSNEVFVDGITVLNEDNVIPAIRKMTEQYFNRRTLNLSILDSYNPQTYGYDYPIASYCTDVPTGITGQTVTGYISSADYKFGRGIIADIQIKKLKINHGTITLLYWGINADTGMMMGIKSYTFTLPEDSHISFENPFFETTSPHTVYFVTDNYTDLDIMAGGSTEVMCAIASYIKNGGELSIFQVDDCTFSDGILNLFGGEYVG